MRKKLLNYLKRNTFLYDKNENLEKFTSQNMSILFGLKRNTVSHYMSEFLKENLIIKVNTRPVYFFHKVSFEKKYFCVEKNIFENLDELFECNCNGKDIFKDFIGIDGSMNGIFEKIKTSIFYPKENTMPMMISGPTGVGKSFLAELIYKFCIKVGVIEQGAPFIILNCAQYANNPELLSSNLFGHVKGSFTGADSDKKGVIELANKGILFLDEVHRLDNSNQEKLFTFMDKGIINKIGDNGNEINVSTRLIFATTELEKGEFLKTFLRRIPINIKIPSINDRNRYERKELIYSFIYSECFNLNKDIYFPKQLIDFLETYKYEGNIGELKNLIRYICGKSYSNNIKNDFIKVRYTDLPDELLRKFFKVDDILLENNVSFLFQRDKNTKKIVKNSNENIYKYYKFLDDKFKMINSDFNKFELETLKLCNDITDEFTHSNINNGTMLTDILGKILYDLKKNIEYKFSINLEEHHIKIISMFCSNILNDRIQYKNKITDDKISCLVENYKVDYDICNEIFKTLKSILNCNFNCIDEIAFTIYIKSLGLIRENTRAKGVILAHGQSTAASIASLVNRLNGKKIYDSFDMPISTKTIDIVEKLKYYIRNIDIKNGVIILVDMGSLGEIYNEIRDEINSPIVIIDNVSTKLALHVAELISNNSDMGNLVEEVKKYNKTNYKIIYPRINKEKIIVVSCVSGMGTAKQMKVLLKKSFPKDSSIKIITIEYEKIKDIQYRKNLELEYEVLCIVSTMNPGIKEVECILVDDIISGKGEDKLYKILKDIYSRNIILEINNKFIKEFSFESIVSSITVLDSQKLINNIDNCLKILESYMQKRISNNKKVILYIHISCLVERLIRNTAIEEYNNIEKFEQCQKEAIEIIKKSFSGIENIYNVHINVAEIGYIYDIIFANLETLETLE